MHIETLRSIFSIPSALGGSRVVSLSFFHFVIEIYNIFEPRNYHKCSVSLNELVKLLEE